MNILRCSFTRQVGRVPARTSYACTRSYAAAAPERERNEERAERPKPIPDSPSFYTTRAAYYDQVMHLEKAIGRSESFLRQHHLLPLPAFAKASLPPLQPVWKDQQEMALEFKAKMTTTRYRRVTKLLNQLIDFERIANTGGCPELADKLRGILEMYESSKKEAFLARGKRKPVVLDEYGRSYTLGKRKTSSARVWMIPVQPPDAELLVEQALRLPDAPPITFPVTTSTILVNNLPLNQFFPLPADRERVTRPFKVAGVLGKYNVFAIVRGGGTTGQSSALAHGIAKGIVAHDPELETMFRRAKLTWRDPRMVERKKTGLAKARKRYTWVKR
ncbi:ribosomal protein S9/S16-domain-containing protein [Gymnopilus junonius]|uniref:Ribosomal protein S9/S16-domain-containing protein n=1 Tax=Gymnopilus junonius TaxID=109634 RepID=A0A9P5TPB3_GYMJU|nr:ribosomal protein S9/S16-domain-containing protein [Gymnopilus junonius]